MKVAPSVGGSHRFRPASLQLGSTAHVFDPHRLVSWILLVAAAAASLTACLGNHSGPLAPSTSVTAVPPDWVALVDTKAGFMLRYPPSWIEVTNNPGFHGLGSRPGVTSLRDLGDSDTWFAVRSFVPNPSLGCEEPSQADSTTVTTLDEVPAKEFVQTGMQSNPEARVVDIIAMKNKTCFFLQLTAGRSVAQQAVALIGTIASSFRFTG